MLDVASQALAASDTVVLLAVINCHPELKYGLDLYSKLRQGSLTPGTCDT